MLRILRIALMGQFLCVSQCMFFMQKQENINFVPENKKNNLATAMSVLWKAKAKIYPGACVTKA